jgi:hypothetical protein
VSSNEDFSGGFFVALFERSGGGKRCAKLARTRQLPAHALRSFYGSSLLCISK